MRRKIYSFFNTAFGFANLGFSLDFQPALLPRLLDSNCQICQTNQNFLIYWKFI